MKSYDLIVIGGGSAGYAGARTAKELGKSAAVIDGAQDLGGLCILRGCMPSKTLLYSAEILHLSQNANTFGLDIKGAQVNFTALHDRKKKIIGEFQQYRTSQLEDGRFDLYRSKATFSGDKQITLDDGTHLTAKKFLIATGSKVSKPPIPGIDEIPTLTSDEILDLDRQLESVIVLGGGVVGCELAQFLKRTGTRTTLIQRSSRVLKSYSLEASSAIEKAITEEGIQLHTDTQNLRLKSVPGGCVATFQQSGEIKSVNASHVLNALGRTANTNSLNLATIGVECSESGQIIANAYQQTSQPNIYAAGDCCGPHEIVHTAILQAECAVKHAFGVTTCPMDYDTLLQVVFTDPQVASVGLSEKTLKERGVPHIAESYPFNDHGKSILMNALHGYVKVIAHPETGKLLGAECVGKDAGEIIHAMSVAVSLKASVHDLIKTHWYHPTLSEIWTYPLEELAEQIKM